MGNVKAVSILLANLSNAFAMDRSGTKLEELSSHPEILKMLARGKSVRKYSLTEI